MERNQPDNTWKNIKSPKREPKFHIKLIRIGVGMSNKLL